MGDFGFYVVHLLEHVVRFNILINTGYLNTFGSSLEIRMNMDLVIKKVIKALIFLTCLQLIGIAIVFAPKVKEIMKADDVQLIDNELEGASVEHNVVAK